MRVDLGNSSHYDVHDASQGCNFWTVERPGVAKGWYFILPNFYGKRLDGSSFAGVAIKLHHGTAISWGGRVVRHCISITMPDGIDSRSPLDSHQKGDFVNRVYGTFTAAKVLIVHARRKFAAAMASMTEVNTPIRDVDPVVEGEPAVPPKEVQIEGPADVSAFWDGYGIPKKLRQLCRYFPTGRLHTDTTTTAITWDGKFNGFLIQNVYTLLQPNVVLSDVKEEFRTRESPSA